jgi:hypothetical protein
MTNAGTLPISLSLSCDRIDADQFEIQVSDPRDDSKERRLVDDGATKDRHIPALGALGKPVEPLLAVPAQVSSESYLVLLTLQVRPPFVLVSAKM